jgi:hypothetical protein
LGVAIVVTMTLLALQGSAFRYGVAMKKLLFVAVILISMESSGQDLSPLVDRCVRAAKLAGQIVNGSQAGATYGSVTIAIDGSGLPPQQIVRLKGLRDLAFANAQRGVNEFPVAKFDATQIQANYYLTCSQ